MPLLSHTPRMFYAEQGFPTPPLAAARGRPGWWRVTPPFARPFLAFADGNLGTRESYAITTDPALLLPVRGTLSVELTLKPFTALPVAPAIFRNGTQIGMSITLSSKSLDK
jgi:hypothetical protein